MQRKRRRPAVNRIAVSIGFQSRGGGWVVGQSILLLILLLSPLVARHQWAAWSIPIGMLLILPGAILGVAGARSLGTNRTAFPAPLDSSTLVCAGAYRFVRHPLYGSLMLLGAGWSLAWQSAPALLASLALAILLYRKSLREEALLRAKFPEYAAYASRVRRFIPGIW